MAAIRNLFPRAEPVPSRDQGVLVVAANVEQALALGRLLPDWTIYTSDKLQDEGLTEADRKRLAFEPKVIDPFGCPPLDGIVTVAALPTFTFSRVGVLVRADAGVSLPALEERELVEPVDAEATPFLVVDFVDCHHPELWRQSRRRYWEYDWRDWFPVGIDPVQGRVERFLRTPSRRVGS